MRINDTEGVLAAEVAGTSVRDTVEAVVTRGDAEPVTLDVEAWSVSWDVTRQIQGQATLTVADPERKLAPWSMGDLLAPGGSRVALAWISGTSGMRVPLGRWRIRGADPEEQWRVMDAGQSAVSVASGGRVVLKLDEDAMATPVIERMDAETVRSGATRLGEVRRLLSAVGVALDVQGVTDAAVPSGLVYEAERMDAIEDHLTHRDAVYRGGPEGALEVLPRVGGSPVWQIAGGRDGALVSIARTLSDDQVYNAAISSGEDAAGKPLVGRAYLQTGPLAWGGPFGTVPVFHRSPATTQAGVQADAQTLLNNRLANQEVTIEVSCLFHPALQLHDVVQVVAPTRVGGQALTGRVVSMSVRSITGSGSTPAKSMQLGVSVPVDTLEMIAARVARDG